MSHSFDPRLLQAAYDRSQLVPFIGSGMSVGPCTDWRTLVERLEQRCERPPPRPERARHRLIERAAIALQVLRQRSDRLPEIIRQAVYEGEAPAATAGLLALAKTYWPLVCTTNYDELYLLARESVSKNSNARIRVLGRSDADCRVLLQQLGFPSQQVIWALQGFLAPRAPQAKEMADANCDFAALEAELVVGHAEYRAASHRAPQFRRAFAELFRSRSLLFIGSGLAETYFRALFDEIIELAGPPLRPHYAIVPEDSLDVDFMLREYHIVCWTYPVVDGDHSMVEKWLDDLARHLSGQRARATSWGFHVAHPRWVDESHADPGFHVMRAGLPLDSAALPANEVVAVSCGRGDEYQAGAAQTPLPGSSARRVGITPDEQCEWLDQWTIRWPGRERLYGVVARKTDATGTAARTPRAVVDSFLSFLLRAERDGYTMVHTQLLAGGSRSPFHPWVSMVQMAAAYGEYAGIQTAATPRVKVRVYVVDPAVIALLQGNYLDLISPMAEKLQRINVEVVDMAGGAARRHALVDVDATLETLPELGWAPGHVKVRALPTPQKEEPTAWRGMTFRDFGVVSGSTLIVDCRRH